MESISWNAFGGNDLDVVNYNCNVTSTLPGGTYGTFYHTYIDALNIGSNVANIGDYMFYGAYFTFQELTVDVSTIGEGAFGDVWTEENRGILTLTENVTTINPSAFIYNYFQTVNYNCSASGSSTYNTEGIFYETTIYELNIGESVTKIPAYCFFQSYFKFDELVLDVEQIGKSAFFYIWKDEDAGKLTLTEKVNYIFPSVFSYGNFAEVNYYANAEGESGYNTQSIFYNATINSLTIGENVTTLPGWLFYDADFKFKEFTVNVEEINEYAFGYTWSSSYPATLTLGERVTSIYPKAFCDLVISDLNYNTSATMPEDDYGAFEDSIIYNIDFGETVDTIGTYMFCHSDIRDTDVVVNAKTVEPYAFAYAWDNAYSVNLVIGETVQTLDQKAFGGNYINELRYNAKDAACSTKWSGSYSPFNGSTVTTLIIDNKAEKLNSYLFYDITLTQEDLVIPDSVTYMGNEVFYNASDFSITNLYVGSGLEEVKADSFGKALTLKNLYVEALTGNDTFKKTTFTTSTAQGKLPVAENVSIHTNSDLYYYFTAKATTITPYCTDHMVETIGEEYLDTTTAQYVTPTYDTCEICNYQTTTYAYEDAHTINFYVDGILYHTAYCKDGESVAEPTEPTRSGYTFKAWDKAFSNITADVEITAIYEIKTYTVTFVDHDGTVLSTQTIEHGSSATAPTEPTREGYDFMGWSRNYSNITADTTVEATYMIKIFSVIFKDLENIISEQQVAYGGSAIEPNAPTRAEEVWGNWIFKGWDAVWDFITGNTIINAIFEMDLKEYTVTFQDYDGTILDTQTVEYGKNAVLPTEPTREGYAFSSWSGIWENIKADSTVTAVYEKNHVHSYDIEVEKKDATCIDKGYIIYGCSCGDTETKEIEINSDNHTGENEVRYEKAASCIEKGYTGDTYCKSCEAQISEGMEIDFKDHVPGQEVEENRVEPTTETMGSYDEVIYCDICDTELSREKKDIPMLTPEDPTEPVDPTEPDEPEDDEDEEDEEDDSETPIETESEEPTETEEIETEAPQPSTETEEQEEDEPAPIPIAVPLVAGAGVAGSTGTVYFIYWKRRRKIYGTVLDHSGNTVSNAKVYLEGAKVMETVTDENGYFAFKNLKVGDYQFILANELDVMLMEANIHTEEKDKEQIVDILQSSCEVEAEHIHNTISLIITI